MLPSLARVRESRREIASLLSLCIQLFCDVYVYCKVLTLLHNGGKLHTVLLYFTVTLDSLFVVMFFNVHLCGRNGDQRHRGWIKSNGISDFLWTAWLDFFNS